jgi:glucokinase
VTPSSAAPSPDYLGIDLGGSSIKWCTVNGASGSYSEVAQRDTPEHPELVREALEEVIRENSARTRLGGICVGTPGLVDDDGRILGSAVNLPGWGNEPLAQTLSGTVQVPLAVKNDTNLATLAETRVGAARGYRHVCGIFLGTGIGGGLCINEALYEGAGGLAGEVGHIVVESGGAPCPCGQRGCVERYSSATGIVRLCRELEPHHDSPLADRSRSGQPLSAAEVYEALAAGDSLARAVHGEVCAKLAQATGTVLNVLSPEIVVLGGGVMRSGAAIIEGVRERLPGFALEHIRGRAAVAPASLGVHAGAIGAALYAREYADRTDPNRAADSA